MTGSLTSEACWATGLRYFWSAFPAVEGGCALLGISGYTAADRRGLWTEVAETQTKAESLSLIHEPNSALSQILSLFSWSSLRSHTTNCLDMFIFMLGLVIILYLQGESANIWYEELSRSERGVWFYWFGVVMLHQFYLPSLRCYCVRECTIGVLLPCCVLFKLCFCSKTPHQSCWRNKKVTMWEWYHFIRVEVFGTAVWESLVGFCFMFPLHSVVVHARYQRTLLEILLVYFRRVWSVWAPLLVVEMQLVAGGCYARCKKT